MKLAIMQPYFFPYIGYFQLMNAVDKFVVYDNIQYTKKGWINRNRYLNNGQSQYFTIPLKKDSDYLNISNRELSPDYLLNNKKQLRKIENAYKKAPFFNQVFPLIEKCFLYEESNLFFLIFHSLVETKKFLGINIELLISSQIEDKPYLKGSERVKNICNIVGATDYLNPIGGIELYNKSDFLKNGIHLNFLQTQDFDYPQFNNDFVSFLSIIDVLMFNPVKDVKQYLNTKYDIF